jgi:hypothetical protein
MAAGLWPSHSAGVISVGRISANGAISFWKLLDPAMPQAGMAAGLWLSHSVGVISVGRISASGAISFWKLLDPAMP